MAAAVEHELARLRAEYFGYGMELDVAVRIDESARTVVVAGESLRLWGPRMRTEAVLDRAGLRWETWTLSATIVVRPAAAGD
jgi:hypothetical protein